MRGNWPLHCFAWVLCASLLLWHCEPPSVTGPGPAVAIWPKAGVVSPGTLLSLTTTPGAQIFYTLDETLPSPTHGYLYDGAFPLWGASVVRWIAVDQQGRIGPAGAASYTLDIYPPLSAISPPSGNKREPTRISFETNPDATVFYTLDGTLPTDQSRRYSAPFTIERDTVVRYFARDLAGNRELVQRAVYNFAPQLSVTPPSGLYFASPIMVKASSNEAALIQYRQITPLGPWQQLQDVIELKSDAEIQVTSTDLSGLSTSVLRSYSVARSLEVKTSSSALKGALATALIDLEGLGKPRLLVATVDALYTIAPRADGGWGMPMKLASLAFTTRFIRVWDLDGDGLSDILLGDQSGGLHPFQTIAATLIKPAPSLLGPWTPASQLQMIVPIDVDANGQLDVFLLDRRVGQSRVTQRSTKGYLLPSPIYPPIEAGAVGALAADFDKDGDADLLILPGAQRTPYFLHNDGKGEFSRLPLISALQEHPGVTWLHAARSDFDLDGDLDLILVGRGPAPLAKGNTPPPIKPGTPALHVVFLRHHSGGAWQVQDRWLGPDQAVRGVLVSDIDADGFDDLMILPAAAGAPIAIKQVLGRRLMQLPFQPPRAPWPSAIAATAAAIAEDGRVGLLLIQADGMLQEIFHLPTNPTYLRLLIQGIQGNRNAIGAQIFARSTTAPTRLREIGIRHTGPDQTELFLPFHFPEKSQISSLTVRWPEGVEREIPMPSTNKSVLVNPP